MLNYDLRRDLPDRNRQTRLELGCLQRAHSQATEPSGNLCRATQDTHDSLEVPLPDSNLVQNVQPGEREGRPKRDTPVETRRHLHPSKENLGLPLDIRDLGPLRFSDHR